MFREMRRKNQQVTNEECIEILKNENRAVLSVINEDGYPYGIPVDFYYDEENNKIYLHGAKEGSKIDSIKKDNKVCFTVYNQGFKKENDWAWWSTSVIIFGKAELVDDIKVTEDKLRKIGLKYYPTSEEVDEEIKHALNRVQIISISIEHMTGKLVHEK